MKKHARLLYPYISNYFDRLLDRAQLLPDRRRKIEDVLQWLSDNMSSDRYHFYRYATSSGVWYFSEYNIRVTSRLGFKLEEDALLFALRWGS